MRDLPFPLNRRYVFAGLATTALILFGLHKVVADSQSASQTAIPNSCSDTSGSPESRIASCSELIAHNQKSYALFYDRGLVYNEKGDEQNAISDFSAALSFNPTLADAFYLRAVNYYNSKQYEKSISDTAADVAIKSDDFEGFNVMGLSNIKIDNYAEALKDANRALDLNKNYYDGFILKARALILLHHNNDAISPLSLAEKLDSTRWDSHYYLGLIYKETGNIVASVDELRTACHLDTRKVSDSCSTLVTTLVGAFLPGTSTGSDENSEDKKLSDWQYQQQHENDWQQYHGVDPNP